MSVFPVFPADIAFRFPADIRSQSCRLAWRRSRVDGRSRNDFRWPFPGEWTEEVKADGSGLECSWGLHAAKNWAGSIHAPLFQLIAVPEEMIAHDDVNKFRFGRAAVLAHVDVVRMICDGAFRRADLQEANLQGADLQGADLQGADLQEANLQGADLQYANLQYANLQYADLQYANLQYANLQHASLQEANLQGADLQYANLQYANLQHASLQHANFWGADLQGADLQYANLQYANFQGADLWGADFREANVLGAIGLPS